MERFEALADMLHKAAVSATEVEQITHQQALSLDDAYAIQKLVVDRRITDGDRWAGFGLAFSSRAKAKQFGLSEQIFGSITSGMEIADGGVLKLARFVHPRVETELSFIIGKDITGPAPCHELMRSVDAVAVTLDVIDSRYRDFKFTIPDVVADNSSHAGYCLGNWCPPDTDIDNLGMLLEIDGREAAVSSTAALLGHPARCLRKMAQLAAERGLTIPAGAIVMCGSSIASIKLEPGMAVRLYVKGMGTAAFEVE